jgi:hypothetical protein
MLRKLMALGAMVLVVVAAACNSVTGPADPVSGTNGGRGSGDPRGQDVNKVCLDDLRAVSITSPIEGQILHNGQMVLVSLEVEQFCSGFTATIEVSTDGGASFQELAAGRSLSSALWKLPQLDNLAPVVRVRAWDNIGSVEAERATSFLYNEPQPTKRDQQRD